jgi:hypothetical protein
MCTVKRLSQPLDGRGLIGANFVLLALLMGVLQKFSAKVEKQNCVAIVGLTNRSFLNHLAEFFFQSRHLC